VGKGSLRQLVVYLETCIKNGLEDLGIDGLPALHEALALGALKLEVRSTFGSQLRIMRSRVQQRSSESDIAGISPLTAPLLAGLAATVG